MPTLQRERMHGDPSSADRLSDLGNHTDETRAKMRLPGVSTQLVRTGLVLGGVRCATSWVSKNLSR